MLLKSDQPSTFYRVDALNQINRPSPFVTAVFINYMADVSPKFKKTKNAPSYYQQASLTVNTCGLKITTEKKLDKLYQRPYKVVKNRSTEQSLYIVKGSNVKPLNITDEVESINSYYNLRQKRPVKYAEMHSLDEM